MNSPMKVLAGLIRQHDRELREALAKGRAGLMRRADGSCYIAENVPLGQKHSDEVIQIFADMADLELYYQLYERPRNPNVSNT